MLTRIKIANTLVDLKRILPMDIKFSMIYRLKFFLGTVIPQHPKALSYGTALSSISYFFVHISYLHNSICSNVVCLSMKISTGFLDLFVCIIIHKLKHSYLSDFESVCIRARKPQLCNRRSSFSHLDSSDWLACSRHRLAVPKQCLSFLLLCDWCDLIDNCVHIFFGLLPS